MQPAWAQSTKAPTDLGTIGASTAAGAYRPDEAAKNTASSIAPSQASLQATQPQSIITREFIDLYAAPTADYSRIVNFAPGLSGSGGANGPGLSETKTIIRGFSDDQTNVTFDGIPFADTNNPAHHSTAYFPASVFGGAVVERGPGNASNIGFATFGGSINLFSKKPSEVPVISVFGTVGTWNTRLIGASYESGRLADWGDATLQLNYQKLESDGYLTNSPIRSDNFTLKFDSSKTSGKAFTQKDPAFGNRGECGHAWPHAYVRSHQLQERPPYLTRHGQLGLCQRRLCTQGSA